MQLSIEPADEVHRADDCDQGDAADGGSVPPIGISDVRNGRFEYASSQALSLMKHPSRHTLHVTPITLASPSRVRAVVRSNFDQSPLMWVLTSGGGSGQWRGKVVEGGVCAPTMDGCELDAVVQAGQFSLRLWQPIAGSGNQLSPSSSPSSPSHSSCVSYMASLVVSSQDKEEEEEGGMKVAGGGAGRGSSSSSSGCVGLVAALPSKLVMKRGMWSSPRVSMPDDGLGSGTSRSSFSLEEQGAYRVFFTATSSTKTSQVSLRLEESPGARLQGGEPERGWSDSEGYSWDVECDKAPCSLTLNADFNHEPASEGCPTFSLGAFVRHRKDMADVMACPPGAGTSLPPSVLRLDPDGRATAQFDAVLPCVLPSIDGSMNPFSRHQSARGEIENGTNSRGRHTPLFYKKPRLKPCTCARTRRPCSAEC